MQSEKMWNWNWNDGIEYSNKRLPFFFFFLLMSGTVHSSFRIEKKKKKMSNRIACPLHHFRIIDLSNDNAINWRVQQAEKPTDLHAD